MEVLIIPPLILLFVMLPAILVANIQDGRLADSYENQRPFVQLLIGLSGAIVIWLFIGVVYWGLYSLMVSG